jgi:hypothetical protein
LSEASCPQYASDLTALFISVNRTHFAIPNREISVRAHLGSVDLDMERTVHRLKNVRLFFFILHEREHLLFIVVDVS